MGAAEEDRPKVERETTRAPGQERRPPTTSAESRSGGQNECWASSGDSANTLSLCMRLPTRTWVLGFPDAAVRHECRKQEVELGLGEDSKPNPRMGCLVRSSIDASRARAPTRLEGRAVPQSLPTELRGRGLNRKLEWEVRSGRLGHVSRTGSHYCKNMKYTAMQEHFSS